MDIQHASTTAFAAIDTIVEELMQLAQYKSVPGYKRCVKELRKKLFPNLSQKCPAYHSTQK